MNKSAKFVISIVSIFCFISCQKEISHPLFIEGDGVFDFEGNIYSTVVIGDQEWTSENLRSRIYCNGDSIPYTDGSELVRLFNDDTTDFNTFGLHYNYEAVQDTSGLCPCEWHVANEYDYATLIDYLGGYLEAMPKMKSSGYKEDGGLWVKLDESIKLRGTNSSGFNAVPAGFIFYDSSMLRGSITRFWAVAQNPDESIYFEIGNTEYVGKQILTNPLGQTTNYFSVRCVKNL